MLQNRTAPAAYWEQVGRQALEQGVEKIVMMGAREPTAGIFVGWIQCTDYSDWEVPDDGIRVAANPKPAKQPAAW